MLKRTFAMAFSSFFIVNSQDLFAGSKSKPSMDTESSFSAPTKSPRSGVGKNYLTTLVAGIGSTSFHGEANLMRECGLGMEYGFLGKDEMATKEDQEKYGESLMKEKGQEFVATVARYSEEQKLGGFFWLLGAGYQQQKYSWKTKAKESDTRYSLADETGHLNHKISSSGPTGHARFGYRYVANDWPFAIGGFFGFKHYQGTEKDEFDPESSANSELKLSSTTPEERKKLQRVAMTQMGIGLELGFAF